MMVARTGREKPALTMALAAGGSWQAGLNWPPGEQKGNRAAVKPVSNHTKEDVWDDIQQRSEEVTRPGRVNTEESSNGAQSNGDGSLIAALKRCPLFSSVCDAERARILAGARAREYSRGEL